MRSASGPKPFRALCYVKIVVSVLWYSGRTARITLFLMNGRHAGKSFEGDGGILLVRESSVNHL